jgi:hypothetical protein
MFDDGELMERAGQIHALAAELAAGIDGQLSGPVAGMAVEEVFGALRQAELAACRLIERVDRSGEFSRDGFVSVNAYVRERAGESQGWASKRVHVGRALADRLPATAAAWEKGALGLEHAVVIDKATRELKDAGQVRVVDEALAGACPWASPHDLAGIAEQIRAATAPEAAADKADKQRMAAKLSLSKTLDGMWRLDGWLDPETGALVNQALGAFTDPTRTGGSGGAGQPEALAEPIALRRARALGEICRQAAGHAESCNGTGGGRHTMIITMDWEALRSGLGVGTVAGDRSTLPAGALRRLACDAAIIPAVLGGDGAILDFGRKPGSSPRHCGLFSSPGTADASSRGAIGPRRGATRIIARPGTTAAAPTVTIWTCSARSIITWCMRAGTSRSPTTPAAPPGSTRPTAEPQDRANADPSCDIPANEDPAYPIRRSESSDLPAGLGCCTAPGDVAEGQCGPDRSAAARVGAAVDAGRGVTRGK